MNKTVEKLFSRKYLFFTNISIGFTFHTIGDIISQNLEIRQNPSQPFSYRRLIAMGTGGLFYGACGHNIYTFIDRKYRGRSLSIIKYKLLIDAITCPPLAFFGTVIVGATEGRPVDEIWLNIHQNLIFILAFDGFLYIPFQVINYRYIDPRFRYVFVASSSLIYSTYLSFILHRNQKKDLKSIENSIKTLD